MEKLGAPLSNGDEYDIRKVEEIALTILRERLLAKRFDRTPVAVGFYKQQ